MDWANVPLTEYFTKDGPFNTKSLDNLTTSFFVFLARVLYISTHWYMGTLHMYTTGEAVVPYYLEILQALHPLFSLTSKGTEGGVVDNAAAAVARMIMAAPGAVPMDQVLPVLLSALPLKSDRSENEAVYTCLLGLIHLRHQEALRLLDSIMSKYWGSGLSLWCWFCLLVSVQH